jgi:hypothetical protein
LDFQEKKLLNQIRQNEIELERKIIKNSLINKAIYKTLKNYSSDFQTLDSINKLIFIKLKIQDSNIEVQFNKQREINIFFKEGEILETINKIAFKKRDSNINYIKNLLPALKDIKSESSKKITWEEYLYLNKPFGISYLHFKRLKVLLLEEHLEFQSTLIKSLNVKLLNQIIKDQNDIVKQNLNKKTKPNILNENNSKQFEIEKDPKGEIGNTFNIKFSTLNLINEQSTKTEKTLVSILTSISIDKYFVGIQNLFLKDINDEGLNYLKLEFTPNAQSIKINNNLYVTFNKPGIHVVKFVSKEKSKILFEKKIKVMPFPEPQIRLNGLGISSGFITKRELLASNKFILSFPEIEGKIYPGRILGFQIVKYGKENSVENVYNYSESFQQKSISIIENSARGDVLIINNLTISSNNGITKTAPALIFKITD